MVRFGDTSRSRSFSIRSFPRPDLLAATLPAASDSSIRERTCALVSPALRWTVCTVHGKAGSIMTTTKRRLIVVVPIAAVLLLANFLVLAKWLEGTGLIQWAQSIHTEYITGTAITVVAAMLILLPSATGGQCRMFTRTIRCPVCDESLRPGGRYCPACGSRVTA